MDRDTAGLRRQEENTFLEGLGVCFFNSSSRDTGWEAVGRGSFRGSCFGGWLPSAFQPVPPRLQMLAGDFRGRSPVPSMGSPTPVLGCTGPKFRSIDDSQVDWTARWPCVLFGLCDLATFTLASHKCSPFAGKSGWKWSLERIHTRLSISRHPFPSRFTNISRRGCCQDWCSSHRSANTSPQRKASVSRLGKQQLTQRPAH